MVADAVSPIILSTKKKRKDHQNGMEEGWRLRGKKRLWHGVLTAVIQFRIELGRQKSPP